MKQNKITLDRNLIFLLFGFLATSLGLLFLYLVTTSAPGDTLYYFSTENNRNLHAYAVSIFICLLSFFLLCLCFRKKLVEESLNRCNLSSPKSFILLAILLSFLGYLLFDLFRNKEDRFYGYANKFPVWFSATLVILSIIFVFSIILNENTTKKNNYSLFVLYAILGFLNAVKYGVLNQFASAYGFYHCNAVTQTIYNVHYNTPYDELTSGIYGHYALFFKPFTTIFGASPVTIGIIIAIVGLLTSLLSFLTIHLIVKSDIIKAIAAIALAFFMNVITETYWQTMPIRWFFPAIILFLAVIYEKKQVDLDKVKNCLLGFFICSLAILWETESGLFVAIVWSCFCALRSIQDKGLSLKRLLKLILIHVSAIVGEIILAVSIMNVYNLLVGGKFDFKVFFFPLFTGFVSVLQTELKFGNMYYIYAIIAYMCCLLWALSRVFFYKLNPKHDYKACSIAAISLMGLAILTYYINRTAAGVNCAYMQIIMCNSIIADAAIIPLKSLIKRRKSSIHNVIKIAIGTCAISVLTIIVLLSSYTLPKAEERFNRGDYDIKALSALAEEVKATVPKDTYSIGFGTIDIYGMLGWDTQYHLRDFADLETDGKKDEILSMINSDINKQEYDLFVGAGEYFFVPERFKLVKEFKFMDHTYGYFHSERPQ